MLVVTDPHFGKPQVFRETGIPLPAGTTESDLNRLSLLTERLRPKQLLFLGDLVHGRLRRSEKLNRLIQGWRRRHADLECLLITGTHDRRAGAAPPGFRFDRIAEEIVIDPFVFRHEPKPPGVRYGVSGHLHPAVSAKGQGRQKETLPCFCFGITRALLPAFGSFTGSKVIRPAAGDRVFAVAGEEIVRIGGPGSLRSA